MRLIDADKLKEKLKNLKASGENKYYKNGVNDCLHEYLPRIIDDIPTVDLAVLHDMIYRESEIKNLQAEIKMYKLQEKIDKQFAPSHSPFLPLGSCFSR